jgi:hypothetical protein
MICAALQAPQPPARTSTRNQRAHHFPKDVRYIRNGAQTILPAAHIILPGRANHFRQRANHFALRRKSFCLLPFTCSIAPRRLSPGEGARAERHWRLQNRKRGSRGLRRPVRRLSPSDAGIRAACLGNMASYGNYQLHIPAHPLGWNPHALIPPHDADRLLFTNAARIDVMNARSATARIRDKNTGPGRP